MAWRASRGAIIRLVLRRRIPAHRVWLILGITAVSCHERVLTSQLYGLNPFIPSFSRQPYSCLIFALIARCSRFAASAVSPSQALRTE